MKVVSFARRVAGLSEPSLESEFYEEFTRLGRHLELKVVTDDVEGALEEFEVHKVKTIKFPKLYGLSKILAYVRAVWSLREWADLLYVRTFSPPESIALWFGRRVLGIRAALLIPGTWLFEPPTMKNRLWRWILSKALKAADLIILYTPLMLPDVKRYFPDLVEEKIVYVHNAVNTERFKPRRPRKEVLEKFGLEDERIILFVGRISRRKGADTLVKAFKRVAEEDGEAVLVLVGGEEKGYGELVRREAEREGLSEKALFLGPIPNSDIPDLMCASEVFVYPSRGGEGIPRAILEAMASGLPVVATRVAGIPEAVKNGVTGFLVNIDDWEALAEKIITLLQDRMLRERMGREARRLVEQEFSYDLVIPRLLKVLEKVGLGDA